MQQAETADKNIFDTSKEPDINIQNSKPQQVRLVKKKKKKTNRMSPYAVNAYEQRKKSQYDKSAQRVFVDGRTFQEIIESCRKPKRLPPSFQTEPQELVQQWQEKQEVIQQPQLRFHIPRADPLKDKSRRRKQLFLRKESQIDEYGSEEIDELAIQNANAAIQKQLQMRKERNPNLQEKMMRFLKKKYNQEEPEPHAELSP